MAVKGRKAEDKFMRETCYCPESDCLAILGLYDFGRALIRCLSLCRTGYVESCNHLNTHKKTGTGNHRRLKGVLV